MDVSVIIPFYKGRRFLPRCLTMLENIAKVNDKEQVEWEVIFVDDNPDDPLGSREIFLRNINIRLISNEVNIGIYSSRKKGLKFAKGTHIVFLDQDDYLEENAIVEQLKQIGDKDGVICNGYEYNEKQGFTRKIYCRNNPIENVNDFEKMLFGSRIISPGLVMLKKESIPKLWTEAELYNQGADDYLLWLLFLKEGKTFSINPFYLFTYNRYISNTSIQLKNMRESREEVYEILKDHNIIDSETNNERLNKDIVDDRSSLYRNYAINNILEAWLEKEIQGRNILNWLLVNKLKKIAIHGMGVLGAVLKNAIEDNKEVSLRFVIDRQADRYKMDIPVYTMDDVIINNYADDVDCIIIAIGEQATIVYDEWKQYVSNDKIIKLTDILEKM